MTTEETQKNFIQIERLIQNTLLNELIEEVENTMWGSEEAPEQFITLLKSKLNK